MRKQLTAVVAFGCLFAAGAALADGPPTRYAPYPQPIYEPFRLPSFVGFYIGAHAGYAVGDLTATLLDDVTTSVEPLTSHHARGGLAGVQLGYNVRFGSTVLGIEGDYSWTDASGSATGDDGDVARARLRYLASVRGRAGIVMDAMLLYATAGVGWGGADFRFRDVDGGPDTSFRLNASGIVFGGGAEFAFANNWSLRAEYLHYSFGEDRHIPILPGNIESGADFSFNSVDVVRVGLNYSFGARREIAPMPLK